jgi:methylated-DNA-protein-cysteine methyltransferase-like protein
VTKAKSKVVRKPRATVTRAPVSRAIKTRSIPASNPAWEAIYTAVERIPRGCVSTYGAVAQLAGLPRRARLVGTALKAVPTARRLPWHRVIGASGRLAFPENSEAYSKARARLAREGVRIVRKRVDLARYGWPRESKTLDELLWGGA